jgi:hypothetical protein
LLFSRVIWRNQSSRVYSLRLLSCAWCSHPVFPECPPVPRDELPRSSPRTDWPLLPTKQPGTHPGCLISRQLV